VIDLRKFRIIDLSYEMVPGEQKIDGRWRCASATWTRAIALEVLD